MKTGGRIPLSGAAICGTYKISCLKENTFANGDSANHVKDQ